MVIMNISFNTILKFVKRAYYIHYLIMMVIGLERMQLTRFGCIWTGDSKEAIEKLKNPFS